MFGNIDMEITSKELIKPSSPTPHDSKRHELSLLDQFINPFYVPLIFFYDGKEEKGSRSNNIFDHHSKTWQHLKVSLADALTKFRHLAGRIQGNVFVDCYDSGALLVEARVHSPLSEAIRNAPIDELSQYLPLQPYALVDGDPKNDDMPLLAIQISCFECGGTAVGVCLSHKVADIASLMMFVNYWAALCRGDKLIDEPLALPICDLASQLFPGLDDASLVPKSDNWRPVKEKLVTKRYLFHKEKLAALKELASSDDFFGVQMKNPTRVEVVSAFIWKQLIEISRAKGDTKSIFLAFHTVNLRARMKSLLPSDRDVFGNLSVSANNSSVKTWGFGNHYQELVWIMRSLIRRIKDDNFIKHVQSDVPFLREIVKSYGGPPGAPPETVDRCFFTSWCRLAMYEVDCGWGKPLSVCTAAVPLIKNTVILMDTRCGDGIEAWMTWLRSLLSFFHLTQLPTSEHIK